MKVANLLLCAFVAFSGAARVEAQGIGGLIKKKVDEVKKTDQPNAKAEQQKSSIHTGDVLPITNTLLDGFKVGLNTEIRLRKEFKQVLASYKTREQYSKCQGEVAMSPEGQKIMAQFTNLPNNITPADLERVMAKMDVEMKALLKNKCGAELELEWPAGKRAAKLEEIEAKAAAAVDPAAEAPVPDLDGAADDAGDADMFMAGITPRQYQILKERIGTFCAHLDKGNIRIDGKPVSIPGSGNGIYWLYTAEEAAFIAKYCKEIMALLDQLV